MTPRQKSTRVTFGALAGIVTLLTVGAATPIKPDLLAGLQWRNVGPFRGGRISAVTGVIGDPGTYYVGTPAGGVWKSTSAGETWYPVFDSVKEIASIGAVEVAPSNPNVVYVGAGDKVNGGGVNVGTGMYKSEDAGGTWKRIGLDDARVIPSIIVDPKNPDLVLVAAEGDLVRKSEMRGVYRSTDGGRTWTRTLFVNDSTGIQKIARAYDRPDVIFATSIRHWNSPTPSSGIFPAPTPPAPGAAPVQSATRLYKSTDEGLTWTEVTGGGLPRLNGCEYVAVAQNTNAQRVFVIGNNGLFRSDDGGASWRQMDKDDERIRNGQGGYNCGIYVNTKNPDIVYSIHTSSYISTDGGNTFTGFKGAPGGDDPQQFWLDPVNSNRMLFGVDQGATVTLDGGKTWSSWYNQSTEQVYHISVDNSFPYWIYATQQDAGAVRTRSRGNFGQINPLDQSPVPAWEWGTIIPDPLNPNTVYASGNPSGLEKMSYPSEQWIPVSPAANPDLRLRTAFSQPIMFAPWNQHELLAGFQFVMATTDAGVHWKKISPDLTWPKGVAPVPDSMPNPPGAFPRGAIESMSASTVGRGTIWAATNTGVIKVTKDEGKTWDDASIPNLPFAARALISSVDASHTDAGGAYVAVDVSRAGDYTPYFYRTHDFGKTWTLITKGLPTDEPSASFARVVRADPKRAGLLVAGTESGMYVSFDDGDSWQSFMQNLPNTSYREIAFAGNDLVVGTYGRGIYVLDDYAVLRQLTPEVAAEPVHLFKPDPTVRTRRNTNFDTPFPPEVPHALNPPDGVIIYYSLDSKPSGEITIDVLDSAGTTIRHMSSIAAEPVKEAARPPHPNWWVAPPFAIPAAAGLNRTNWDLRFDAPPAFSHSFEINANPGLTPATPEGIMAPPGTYTVKLTVGGKSYSQKVSVSNDPRSPTSAAGVRAQYALLRKLNDGVKAAWDAYQQVEATRAALTSRMPSDTASDAAKAIKAFRAKVDTVGGNAGIGGGAPGRRPPPNFYTVHGRWIGQLTAQDNGDQTPSEPMLDAFASTCRDMKAAVASWAAINGKDLAALNAALTRSGAQPVPAAAGVKSPDCGAPPAQFSPSARNK